MRFDQIMANTKWGINYWWALTQFRRNMLNIHSSYKQFKKQRLNFGIANITYHHAVVDMVSCYDLCNFVSMYLT